MFTLKQLGGRLRETRRIMGFSQQFVAQKLGLSRQAVIAMESGKRKVDSFELFKLSDLYGINVADLVGEGKTITPFSFQEKVVHLRKKSLLTEEEKEGLLEFQKICEDYEFLKRL